MCTASDCTVGWLECSRFCASTWIFVYVPLFICITHVLDFMSLIGVKVQELESFHHGVQNGKLKWCSLEAKSAPTVSERYSHCACYHNKSMYIFGGCTHTCTTFNDLWRLDLTTGEWVRPLATGDPIRECAVYSGISNNSLFNIFVALYDAGVYPSPTACATLVPYEDQLILFGGWCHPTPYTFHQVTFIFLSPGCLGIYLWHNVGEISSSPFDQTWGKAA